MRMWTSFALGGGRHYSAYPTNGFTYFPLDCDHDAWSPSGALTAVRVAFTLFCRVHKNPVYSLLYSRMSKTHISTPGFSSPIENQPFTHFAPLLALLCPLPFTRLCPTHPSVRPWMPLPLWRPFCFGCHSNLPRSSIALSILFWSCLLLWSPWPDCKLPKGKNPILLTLIS